jgi:predicted phosphodiesterase
MIPTPLRIPAFLASALIAFTAMTAHAADTVSGVMDELVTRIYADLSQEARTQLTQDKILAMLSEKEKEVLSTRYVHFDVNVPVVVSVMREMGQETVPFWLDKSGFEKTDLIVTNTENWQYEVWQKEFDAGHVGLGINGFDQHRAHYFISVGAKSQIAPLKLTNLVPDKYSVGWVHEGAFVYHDWDELHLKEVPDQLVGDRLITTIRGRAREAHLIGGFRETPTPSSETPDQIALTWNGDTATTQSVQWRTSTAVENGVVAYREYDGPETFSQVTAERVRIENRMLANDRYCNHFTGRLTGLKPDTTYVYKVGDPDTGNWSDTHQFHTGPAKDKPFTFITFGDTHQHPVYGQLLDTAIQKNPDAAFVMIAGDLVNTGQYRDHWDIFHQVSNGGYTGTRLVPAVGNHDAIDGLGAGMFRTQFDLPENGPEDLPTERTYTLRYGNTELFILDSTLPIVDQGPWLEEQLQQSDATWKVAMFHFPAYNYEEPYPEIRSLWGYLFDKYHVDIVLTGHIHYYMRSHPMRQDNPRETPADGTIHVLSIGIPNRKFDLPPAEYAAVQFTGPGLYQTFKVDGPKLTFEAWDQDGDLRDSFTIEK